MVHAVKYWTSVTPSILAEGFRTRSAAKGDVVESLAGVSLALALGEKPAQDVLEDPAVAEVLALLRRVQSHARSELHVVRPDKNLIGFAVLDAGDRELLTAGEAEALAALAVHELQRDDPAHQQVRAVDPLVALGDRRPH